MIGVGMHCDDDINLRRIEPDLLQIRKNGRFRCGGDSCIQQDNRIADEQILLQVAIPECRANLVDMGKTSPACVMAESGCGVRATAAVAVAA